MSCVRPGVVNSSIVDSRSAKATPETRACQSSGVPKTDPIPHPRLLLDAAGRAVLRGRGPTADLLRRELGRPLQPAERDWVQRIEGVRTELARREDRVPFEVPGEAGGPGDREVGELCRTASQSPGWARMLFRLLRAIRPERCLELGTCLGISASYQAAGLRLNGEGSLVTVEGHPAVAAQAGETLAGLGLADLVDLRVGWFHDVLDDVVAEIGRLDYAYVDGHHQGAATLDYFARMQPALSRGATVVFDDIRWSSDMRDAWREIAAHPRTRDALDLGRLGIWVQD